ncbi:FAD-dependent monooxygenase [uncultured Tateyamaria sp.]|uniref:FAD binding domain-containing protein n=1 Tax=uncultured Tateyamaria sp. TaxID=455651 RepID=UPI0026249C03|nr:FAD-dependent monooxygenase [uncultured Tateyamaria sp.]
MGQKIAIIGGSIAGTMAAILLSRAGHSVDVFERSRKGLVGRGGGVTTSRRVLNEMKAADILDENFPSMPYSELQLSKVTDATQQFGHCPLSVPLDMRCVHWSGMWENMRRRLPDDIYHNDMQLLTADHDGDSVRMTFADSDARHADIVLFADGYHSLGRRIMFPEVDLEYRGYTVWRGVVPESQIEQVDQLAVHPRFSLRNQKGSFISYMIPSREGSEQVGDRLFNWACYFPLAQSELADFMVDKDGVSRVGTIPAGYMRAEQDDALKSMIRDNLPKYYADIVCSSTDNQIQQIYTSDLPAYRKGRMCLMGDAGIMVPPLTGAGVFKGFTNARDLTRGLATDAPLDDILSDWSAQQTKVAVSMLNMGLDMEDAFIWNTIDLATHSPQDCAAWFDKSINIAKEFSYFAA